MRRCTWMATKGFRKLLVVSLLATFLGVLINLIDTIPSLAEMLCGARPDQSIEFGFNLTH